MDGFLDKLSAALGMGWIELENKYKKGQSGSACQNRSKLGFLSDDSHQPHQFQCRGPPTSGPRRSGGKGTKLKTVSLDTAVSFAKVTYIRDWIQLNIYIYPAFPIG